MAQKSNWAIFFPLVLISQLSALLIYEQNLFYLLFFSPALFYLSKNKLNIFILAVALIGLAYLIGPYSLIISIPIFFWRLGYLNTGLKIGLFLLSLNSLSVFIENFSNIEIVDFNLSSLLALFLPNLSLIAFLCKKNLKPILNFLYFNIFIFLLVILLSASWLTPTTFTSPIFRVIVVLIPSFAFFVHKLTLDREKISIKFVKYKIILCIFLISSIFIFNHKKPNQIIFDESHGLWETVNAEYTPSSFGRGANYTYSLLKEYTTSLGYKTSIFSNENQELPNKGGLFVLKMPTLALSDFFIVKITDWVREGGSLLVISDHTDLYDSAQNINKLITFNSGTALSDKAVFDKNGFPNKPNFYLSNILAGHHGGNDVFFPWQTGTSINSAPLISNRFISYGMSFAESGIYSNQNRFGDFDPDLKDSYLNHTAGLAWPLGSGNIILITDSTPWSNFSIYKSQYKHLYKSIIDIASNHSILLIVGFLPFLIFINFVFSYYDKKNKYAEITLLLFILTISVNTLFAISTFYGDKEDKDFKTIIVTGSSASVEYLKQIIPIGANNYSRIIASLNKYQLNPILFTYDQSRTTKKIQSNILFIEPNIAQLPKNSEIFKALAAGRNITILFDRSQINNKSIQRWISELGLIIKNKAMLSNEENFNPMNDDFISRSSSMVFKNTRYYVFASQYSLLKFKFGDSLVQSFTVRPTNLPETSGILNISFSADQFSDNAIGDVWEGVRPNLLGVMREKYFSDVLLGKERIEQPSKEITRISSNKRLKKYLVLKDGSKILDGDLLEKYTLNYNPSKDIQTYLSTLKDDVSSFIDNQCNSNADFTECSRRFISHDLSEWVVTFRKKDEIVNVIEIVRERNSLGLPYTINIVFGN
jgi:hypothetical protein